MAKFRVATEGATTDGREITRTWIEQMAKNYDPNKYGARVWMEHVRGMFADGPFPALGDITAVEAKEVEVDGVTKLGLFAEIDPTDRLKEINQQRQKVYTSIEVDPDFAGTGEAYLEGLGVTDSPASLGTEMLKFSRQAGESSPLATRKQKPGNVFTAAVETELDFSAPPTEPPADPGPSLTERVKALFRKHDAKTDQGFADFRTELEQTLGLFVEKHQSLADDLKSRPSATAFNELKTAHDTLQTRFDELYTQLDSTPRHTPRQRATGDDGTIETDC
ncbi:GPO family capsid scaffolding protein [Chromohalobacter canadensis]|uniref:GPO family capsid scaffolding protein n=1 Tax=Chromohalobacter canadensis TaxID=141389 RepID=UPI0021BE83F2|nr:GPO family capsid scaffolding protein [Chromohalobacter canadensis]MCT8469466.1 GPO family capsid scaffolding protein [Chromohalobacter canadensis]MCT8472090.1 GPO family capsid scaffolding protein [Chromohalobacter canadensis]MCT8499797.1 GPO family capsid scaffolding protein [Chromohalobacter canadensis]